MRYGRVESNTLQEIHYNSHFTAGAHYLRQGRGVNVEVSRSVCGSHADVNLHRLLQQFRDSSNALIVSCKFDTITQTDLVKTPDGAYS
jgi:hypothetical protein